MKKIFEAISRIDQRLENMSEEERAAARKIMLETEKEIQANRLRKALEKGA